MFTIAPVYLVNNSAAKLRYAQANLLNTATPPHKAMTNTHKTTVKRFNGYDHRGEIQPQAHAKGHTIDFIV